MWKVLDFVWKQKRTLALDAERKVRGGGRGQPRGAACSGPAAAVTTVLATGTSVPSGGVHVCIWPRPVWVVQDDCIRPGNVSVTGSSPALSLDVHSWFIPSVTQSFIRTMQLFTDHFHLKVWMSQLCAPSPDLPVCSVNIPTSTHLVILEFSLTSQILNHIDSTSKRSLTSEPCYTFNFCFHLDYQNTFLTTLANLSFSLCPNIQVWR